MPTTDPALFDRTMAQSVGIDRPPPSQQYRAARATNLQALVPVTSSHFFSDTAKRRLLVVITDGEASRDLELFGLGIGHTLKPVFMHVWQPGERIYRKGRVDPHYVADPGSSALLHKAAEISSGAAFEENEVGSLVRAAKRVVGHGTDQSRVNAYARVALAPWVALAGILPLGFLFYRRNF
jgi:hypothetical protein